MLVPAVLLVAQLAVAAYSWSGSNRILLPELERKAHAVASTLANEMSGALAHGGIPSTFIDAAFPMLLAPLASSKLGYSLFDTARILAADDVAALLLTPAFGRLGRRFNIHTPLACLRALPGGLGMMRLAGAEDANALAAALALLGLGHAMKLGPGEAEEAPDERDVPSSA